MSLLSGRLHPMALLWKSCCFSLSCYFEGCERFFSQNISWTRGVIFYASSLALFQRGWCTS